MSRVSQPRMSRDRHTGICFVKVALLELPDHEKVSLLKGWDNMLRNLQSVFFRY